MLLFGEPAATLLASARASATSRSARSSASHAPATVREVVEAGRAPLRLFGRLRRDDRDAVDEAIERVGLADARRPPAQRLSGGQQQRAFIAKALAAEPRLLVLDEPTAGVDVDAQEALAALLERAPPRARGDDPLRLARVRRGRALRRAARARARADRLRRPAAATFPASWHDPSHVHA